MRKYICKTGADLLKSGAVVKKERNVPENGWNSLGKRML